MEPLLEEQKRKALTPEKIVQVTAGAFEIRSDDILGRSAAFDAIVKGLPITQLNTPASFNVLLNNLRGLALDVQIKKGSKEITSEKLEN